MIASLLAALMASAASEPTESVTVAESECFAMVQSGSGVVNTRIPGLHVIERTAADTFSAPELPPGTNAIMCPRSSIVPAPNDWKVLEAGYPLYIVESRGSPDARRVGVLEVSGGQFRYRVIRGALSADEEPLLKGRLGQLQESHRR